MLLKYKHFTFLLLILFFSSSQAAHAYIFDAFIIESYELPLIIDTSIGSYEMSTIFGSYESERAVLESQPWWNNITLTEEFTTLTDDLLGLPNPNGFRGNPFVGPIFTYGLTESIFGQPQFIGCVLNTDVTCFNPIDFTSPPSPFPNSTFIEFTFAIATPATTKSVPEPTTGLLFGISLMMLIFSSRRKRALSKI